ncbi:MAG: hypothetical protein U1E05_15850 [Patescibacteria group bacterium]|nr:hypothetical protein [Patescibacteria group bacterium]
MLSVLVGMGLYVAFLRDNILLARCLPYSNLIVLGNWFPIFAAVFAGLAWRHSSGGGLRRSWPVAGLVLAGLFAAVQPLLGNTPQCANQWDADGICRQTTMFTCSPACAATMLASAGIVATEQEMADLCLTRRGTTWQGLYRSLKIKTAGTLYDVQVFNCTAEELRQYTPGWMILTVGIPRGVQVAPIYEQQYSWTPGTLHAVLLYDFAPNHRVNMADPDVGREQWTTEDLQILFRGCGIRLIRRVPQPPGP